MRSLAAYASAGTGRDRAVVGVYLLGIVVDNVVGIDDEQLQAVGGKLNRKQRNNMGRGQMTGRWHSPHASV